MQNPQHSSKNRRVLLTHFRRFFWHSFLTHIFTWRLIFIFFTISSWGHFSDFFFFEGASGPHQIFFWSPQAPPWGSEFCVLPKQKHHFHMFGKVDVDIDFGPPKPPKIGPLNFFLKVFFDFWASQIFLKKLCPQDGRPKIVKIVQNRILEAT